MAENSKKRFWKFGLVFLAVFSVFFGGNKISSAATVACTDSSAKARCTWTCENCTPVSVKGITCLTTSSSDCAGWCESQSGWNTSTDNCVGNAYSSTTGSATGTAAISNRQAIRTGSPTEWAKDIMGDPLAKVLQTLLYAIFMVIVWFLGVATSLFSWIVNPDNVSFIMENPGLYASWAMVRDFLNLGFILILIYIAFCVIFQIGSYSDGWKKMLLMMVIMALLVNFSFPISRFIIDVSNVIFYYLFNSAFPNMAGSNIFSSFADASKLSEIISPNSYTSSSFSNLFAIIIFSFILMLTLLVLAVLFVIRMVAIGMLIIFSPLGFSGAAFPATKKYAEQWWSNLFKYAFFAPLMMFMIVIAMNILQYAQTASTTSFLTEAQINTGANGVDPGFIASMTFFSIPIVILWMGMITAQKLSIIGASGVTGMAQKTAKWAGKKFSGYNAIEKRVKAFGAERKKREDEKFKGNVGAKLGNWTNATQDTIHGNLRLPGSAAAGKRAAKWSREQNRGDINSAKEAAEGYDVNQLIHGNGRNSGIAGVGSNSNRDDQVRAAGHARELLSRGKEFEDALRGMNENDINQSFGTNIAAGATPEERASQVRAALRRRIDAAEQIPRDLVAEAGRGVRTAAVTGAAIVGGAAAVAAAPVAAAVAGGAVIAGGRVGRTWGALRGRANNQNPPQNPPQGPPPQNP